MIGQYYVLAVDLNIDLQGISKATLGLKLGQLLSDATKAVDSKLYPPRREHRQKRKRTPHDDAGDAEPGGAAAGDGAPVSDAELDSILETSMAALAEEEEEVSCTAFSWHSSAAG